jgi:hypothetical protein
MLPVTEAVAKIPWFDSRDWVPLTSAFGRLKSIVEANDLTATCFNRYVHEGLLELALVAPDGTYRLFDAAERQKLTIRAPLNYQEGCSIEPYHEGRWYVRRSDLDERTAIPSSAARAEAELASARIPPAEPASTPPAEPPRVKPVPPPAPKKRSRKKTTHGGAQTRRARAVLNRIFQEGKYHGSYPDEDEMAWPDVWIIFCEEYPRYAKECPSKFECPSQSTVRRVMGRAE